MDDAVGIIVRKKKSDKERQASYRERHLAQVRQRDKLRKQDERKEIRANKELAEKRREADRQRKALKRQQERDVQKASIPPAMEPAEAQDDAVLLEPQEPGQQKEPMPQPQTPFRYKQSFYRCVKRASSALPQSPLKRHAVIHRLVNNLSPMSKRKIATSLSPSSPPLQSGGRPPVSPEVKSTAEKFFEREDVTYACPGRRDEVYCGKSADGKDKVYKHKRYLLWTFKELLSLFNEALSQAELNSIGYGTFQRMMALPEFKHVKTKSDIPQFSCLCPVCENLDLLIRAVNTATVEKLPTTSKRGLLAHTICTDENVKCIDGLCNACPGMKGLQATLDDLDSVVSLTYYQWIKQDKKYPEKLPQTVTGPEAVDKLTNMLEKFRRHSYNIKFQHAAMDEMRMNVLPGTGIVQVDFAQNYENKQQQEIQSAYFGHENFALYTACVWYCNSSPGETQSASYVIVCNESDHNEHGKAVAFTCNNLLLDSIRSIVKDLKTIQFWSDGCAAQFRSRFTFALLCDYPVDLTITWNYFEAHHGKGVVDAIGGTVKSTVYRDVMAGKLVPTSAQEFASYANHILKTTVMFVDKQHVIPLSDSLVSAERVPGTRQVHQVVRESVPGSQGWKLKFYKNSSLTPANDTMYTLEYNVSLHHPTPASTPSLPDDDNGNEATNMPDLQIGQWFAVYFSLFQYWFVGMLLEVGEGDVDHKVKLEFLEQTNPTQNVFKIKDKCWADKKDVFYKLTEAPTPISFSRSSVQTLSKLDFDKIQQMFKSDKFLHT